ncbi:MAG: cupin domain-containing protein [Phenylobacterium sp.]
MTKPIRRVVMGHDEAGKTVVLQDGPARVFERGGAGLAVIDIWSTWQTPAVITPREPDPTDGPFSVNIPKHGARIRFMDMPPTPPGAEPFMHRTPSIDYGVVIEGEMTMLMDDGQELLLKAGDVIVQRGTNHAWVNRSDQTVRMLFVIVGADFDPEMGIDAPWPPH